MKKILFVIANYKDMLYQDKLYWRNEQELLLNRK